MANVYGTPVLFTKEKNVWQLSAVIVFGPSGAASLDTTASKGFCAVNPDSITITGATTNSSTALSSVSSFAGIFKGMTITGPAGDLQAATTVSSFSATTQTITMSSQAILTDGSGSYQISGGRYRLQLGTIAAKALTPFVKLMGVDGISDVTTGSSAGSATQIQLAPAASTAFLVQNNVSIRTIPQTLTSGSTDASIVLQFGIGNGPGTGFTAVTPGDGERYRVVLTLGNSTAP